MPTRALFATLALFLTAVLSSSALASEIAYVNSDTIIPAMPEYQRAKSEVEAYGQQLQRSLEKQQGEFQAYYTEVLEQSQEGQLSPQRQHEAEVKLTEMQNDLQTAAVEADKALIRKEEELTKPLYEKFNAALRAVAAANDYAYILDKKLLLYAEGGTDATNQVKAQLGI